MDLHRCTQHINANTLFHQHTHTCNYIHKCGITPISLVKPFVMQLLHILIHRKYIKKKEMGDCDIVPLQIAITMYFCHHLMYCISCGTFNACGIRPQGDISKTLCIICIKAVSHIEWLISSYCILQYFERD